MKRFIITSIITLFATLSAAAQGGVPYWLLGSWTAGESYTYIFTSNTVVSIENGQITCEATYSVEDNWINTTSGDCFIINHSDKDIAVEGGDCLYKVKVPSWLLGTWTDGENTYVFTNGTVSQFEYGTVVSKGYYTIDDNWINATSGDCFIISHSDKNIAVEGGDWLYKVKVPSWLLGTWTDGKSKYIFANGSVIIIENNVVTNEGTYTIEDQFLTIYYGTNFGDSLIIDNDFQSLDFEGGDTGLNKLD